MIQVHPNLVTRVGSHTSGKYHQGLIDEPKRLCEISGRSGDILMAGQSSIINGHPGEIPGFVYAFEGHFEYRVRVLCAFPLELHPMAGGSDQGIGRVGVVEHFRFERNSIVIRDGLEGPERLLAEGESLPELGFVDGRVRAGSYVLTLDRRHPRQQHDGNAKERCGDQIRSG